FIAARKGEGPGHRWPGQVGRAGLISRYSALPLCVTGGPKHPLVSLPTSLDLSDCAKDLFVEAKEGQLALFHFWLTNRINIPTAINTAIRYRRRTKQPNADWA